MAEPAGATELPMEPREVVAPPATSSAVAAAIEEESEDEGGEEPAFGEPEAPVESSDGGPQRAGQSRERPFEEVVATIGDLGPPPGRPPIRTEPDLTGEPGPQDERATDLARRLGLR
jgi:hypothetical protein